MKKLLAAIASLVGALAIGLVPASAITFGELDGDDHPNVGSIVIDVRVPNLGLFQFCSGALIDDDVFLTASHCTDPLDGILAQFPDARAVVTFDPTIDEDSTFYSGEWVTNPNYNGFKGKGGRSDPGDVAVFLLDEAPPNIVPAQLPVAGLLDQLKRDGALKNTRFTAVGYGTVRESMSGGLKALLDNVDRRRAEQGFSSLTNAWLNLPMMNTPGNQNGGTCYGDSGGPHFIHLNGRETAIVASITVLGDTPCKASDVTYRMDTASARNFLGNFVDLP